MKIVERIRADMSETDPSAWQPILEIRSNGIPAGLALTFRYLNEVVIYGTLA